MSAVGLSELVVRPVTLPNIEYALDQGMELMVTKELRGEFHARVWLGTPQSSHNAAGRSLPAALEALEAFLSKVGLTPEGKTT
jgi:hypothetical protein